MKEDGARCADGASDVRPSSGCGLNLHDAAKKMACSTLPSFLPSLKAAIRHFKQSARVASPAPSVNLQIQIQIQMQLPCPGDGRRLIVEK